MGGGPAYGLLESNHSSKDQVVFRYSFYLTCNCPGVSLYSCYRVNLHVSNVRFSNRNSSMQGKLSSSCEAGQSELWDYHEPRAWFTSLKCVDLRSGKLPWCELLHSHWIMTQNAFAWSSFLIQVFKCCNRATPGRLLKSRAEFQWISIADIRAHIHMVHSRRARWTWPSFRLIYTCSAWNKLADPASTRLNASKSYTGRKGAGEYGIPWPPDATKGVIDDGQSLQLREIAPDSSSLKLPRGGVF